MNIFTKDELRKAIIEGIIVLGFFVYLIICCMQISDHACSFNDCYQQPYSWWNLVGYLVKAI